MKYSARVWKIVNVAYVCLFGWGHTPINTDWTLPKEGAVLSSLAIANFVRYIFSPLLHDQEWHAFSSLVQQSESPNITTWNSVKICTTQLPPSHLSMNDIGRCIGKLQNVFLHYACPLISCVFGVFAELPKRKNTHVWGRREVSKKVFKDVYVRVLIFSCRPNGPHKFYTTNGSLFGVI